MSTTATYVTATELLLCRCIINKIQKEYISDLKKKVLFIFKVV